MKFPYTMQIYKKIRNSGYKAVPQFFCGIFECNIILLKNKDKSAYTHRKGDCMLLRTVTILLVTLFCVFPAITAASSQDLYDKYLKGSVYELKNPGRVCPADMVENMEKGLDDRYFKQLFQKHGVKIITELNRLRTTGSCCMAIKMRSVTRDQYAGIARNLDRAFDRYPPGFVKRYVKKVVVAGRITTHGAPIGGYTKIGATIVFLSTGRSGVSRLGSIFHHEFNHVLYGYANQVHAAEAFSTAVERGFRYGKGGMAAILSGNGGCAPSEAWFEKGFACKYGLSAVEEDYATLATFALDDWDDFSRRALKHQRIVRKFMGLMQFYNSFDSRMDEYFWMGKSDYSREHRGKNISPLFFLDDRNVTGPRRQPVYKVSDLLNKEPSIEYAKEMREKTRRQGFNSSEPMVINDTVNLYRVTLIPPDSNEKNISMIVVPGMRMKFPLYDRQHVSNYWAIAVQEVALQPFRHMIEGNGDNSKNTASANSADERIFFIEDVLDRERDRRHLRRNAPVRTIYLSTIQRKSGRGTFSGEALRSRAGENWKNPFGFLIINDTLQTCTVKLYLFKENGRFYRTFRLAPNSREAPGLVNSMDAIGVSH